MKKLLFLLLASILLVFTPALVFAQETEDSVDFSKPSIFPVPEPSPTFLGQTHKYSLVLRGNGEAVVSLKVSFVNIEGNTEKNFSLRLPDIKTDALTVYQVITKPRCINYADAFTCLEYQDESFGYYDDYVTN